MLSLLVVRHDGDQMPGPGFFKLATAPGRTVSDRTSLWLDDFDRVVDYWTSHRR